MKEKMMVDGKEEEVGENVSIFDVIYLRNKSIYDIK